MARPAKPSAAAIERREQCAAFDATTEARPLKPPPFDFQPLQVSAAALALRADKRAGRL